MSIEARIVGDLDVCEGENSADDWVSMTGLLTLDGKTIDTGTLFDHLPGHPLGGAFMGRRIEISIRVIGDTPRPEDPEDPEEQEGAGDAAVQPPVVASR